ncbi:urea ABC transporter permease subunit UrtC [Tumidithrix elongata RA019]|uniref:Urea ABC transporter permease subunit UrtC n=1 Tax=Tumidithrix elongata BACA0141 TaxID=2716417 RepID=A0AAW9PS56_9CYAN|nr:urea ABC transporter permease subunit UrtC [Tumidithrix elongata RA019]
MTAIEVQKKQGQIKRSLLIEAAIVIGIALLLIFLVPLLLVAIGQGFRVELLGRFLALAIVALGIDLIWGYTGMLSLGHGVFFGLGGYAFAMYLKLQIPPDATSKLPSFMPLYGVTELPWIWQPFNSFPFTIVAIILIPAIVGALFGFLVFRNRIRGVYFSILTQATTIIFYNIFNGQQKLINGTNGLTDFQTIFGATVNAPETRRVFYILTIIFLALAYALCRWLTSGKFGRLLIAIRDDEPRVRFTGYDPTGFKVLVFAISAALAGIGGALYTPQTGIISPNNSMNIAFSIEMVIWVAVGGRASLSGAILGAVLVNFAKSILSEQFSEIWLFFQGAMFLLVVMVLPDGLVGWARTQGVQIFKTLFFGRKVVPYPSLEEDPEVQYERKNLGD